MAHASRPLNLGSLHSDLSLTLHTWHAARFWCGRMASKGQPAISSLNVFLSIMNLMKRGAEQDDPYSDWWMLRIEDKLAQTKASLQALRKQVDHALTTLPSALSLSENRSKQPANVPLLANAPLGFMAVYLLIDYDDLARTLILAHRMASIDRNTLERWLDEGAHALRSLFALAKQYRYSGTRRDDFASNNAAARAVIETFGPLPPDVLDGTRRSRFAPPLARRYRLSPAEPIPKADVPTQAATDSAEPST